MTKVGPKTVFVVRFEMFAPGGITPCNTSVCPSSMSANGPLAHPERDRLYSATGDGEAENDRSVVPAGTAYAVRPADVLFISSKLRSPQAIGPGRSHAGMTITPMEMSNPCFHCRRLLGRRTRWAAPIQEVRTS